MPQPAEITAFLDEFLQALQRNATFKAYQDKLAQFEEMIPHVTLPEDKGKIMLLFGVLIRLGSKELFSLCCAKSYPHILAYFIQNHYLQAQAELVHSQYKALITACLQNSARVVQQLLSLYPPYMQKEAIASDNCLALRAAVGGNQELLDYLCQFYADHGYDKTVIENIIKNEKALIPYRIMIKIRHIDNHPTAPENLELLSPTDFIDRLRTKPEGKPKEAPPIIRSQDPNISPHWDQDDGVFIPSVMPTTISSLSPALNPPFSLPLPSTIHLPLDSHKAPASPQNNQNNVFKILSPAPSAPIVTSVSNNNNNNSNSNNNGNGNNKDWNRIYKVITKNSVDTLNATMIKTLPPAVRKKNEDGNSLLYYTLVNKKPGICLLLITAGAPIDEIYWNQQNILHIACRYNWGPLAMTVMHRNKNLLNQKDKDGWLPIHSAAELGHLHLVKEMISISTDNINALTKKQSTPLHIAAHTGQLEVVKFLLNQHLHIKISPLDKSHHSPLYHAVTSGHREIAITLIEHGADLYEHYGKPAKSLADYIEEKRWPDVKKALQNRIKNNSITAESKKRISDNETNTPNSNIVKKSKTSSSTLEATQTRSGPNTPITPVYLAPSSDLGAKNNSHKGNNKNSNNNNQSNNNNNNNTRSNNNNNAKKK